MSWIYYLFVILLMLVLSAFFSGSEIAFNAANKMRLARAAEEGNRTAKLAYRISEHFTTALSAILIGNNLANIAASTAATAVFIRLFRELSGGETLDGLSSVVSTVVMTLIVLVFGEIVPKVLSKKHADKVVRWVAVPVLALTVILSPAVLVVMGILWVLRKLWGKDSDGTEPDVTEDELSSIIETVEEEGVIDEDQGELLQSSLEFHETTIEEIMTPRIDLVTIDIGDDPKAVREIIETSRYSRIPVYEDSIDEIIGVLFLNHYFKEAVIHPDVELRPLLMKPCFLHKTMRLPDALHHLRERKTHMAIVIDEYGGTLGVVTMEDILEEIVGDIWDESDEIVSSIVQIAPDKYEVLGDMNIDDFFDEIGYEPKDFECEYSTVGGWAIENLNSDPHVGDVFGFEHLTILVSEMEDDVRVTKLLVTVGEIPEEEEEEE